MIEINGNKCHTALAKKITPKLSFEEGRDFTQWKSEVSEKLRELLGMEYIEENACEPNLTIEEDIMMDGYRRIRFVYENKLAIERKHICVIFEGKQETCPYPFFH